MALNLMWRFLWAFFGNDYARWNAILPYGRGYWRKLRAYGNAFFSGQPQEYVGHNPAARLAIAVLLLLLLLQAATGLILAGTDLSVIMWGFIKTVAALPVSSTSRAMLCTKRCGFRISKPTFLASSSCPWSVMETFLTEY
jgi:Ni,Fe-hydrogenase I cytochrome b subunit